MHCSGWGRYPIIDAAVAYPQTALDCKQSLPANAQILARGLGRSYGDSSLAERLLSTSRLNHFKHFDAQTGVLTCEGGVSLASILDVFVPQGWFLPVTPGTRFVTVGGAIASDVHGKNHHVDGTFCQHIMRFSLLLGNGDIVDVAPEIYPDLFRATCGGMGLTGVILEASLRLKPIQSSNIHETTLKARNLDEVIDAFEANQSSTYSVAWIDCLAKGDSLGRSLLMLGEHETDGMLVAPDDKAINIPCDMPASLLNTHSIKAFNALYYHRIRCHGQKRTVPYLPFFYPLDKLNNWNRLYGKQGFTQYQFVLPKEAKAGLKNILERIADSGKGSFLAVLKAFGPANDNYLSFPREGYTLALDFKLERHIFELLDELDAVVLNEGGRIYMTKDVRMSERTFKKSYPQWSEFESVRAKYHAIGKFASCQSQRLGLQ